MKTKIVLWGTDADGRVLIALELRPDANKVDIFTFPSAIVTDDFTTQMMDKWRVGEEVTLPEGYKHIEIAELLGISINTSKSQLILAKDRMRKEVEKNK